MKRILSILILSALTINIMAQQTTRPATKVTQTAGRDALGNFAPEFAHLNDDILFGEVWSRNDLLSLRDRSLVTITSLISQ
ncbi:MAG: gamma-carboxymuconolactone decarboxylase, partial [Paramuribaculum sp.]|nr:gamma-carboxymuconolactone decarboxylase [Paramuribaculum sp.]